MDLNLSARMIRLVVKQSVYTLLDRADYPIDLPSSMRGAGVCC